MSSTDQNNLKSPLGRARGLGSAKDGVHHWMAQRITAVALIPLLIFFLTQAQEIVNADHETFVLWLAQPLHTIAMMLFIVSAFYHAMLGLQVIAEDYIHHEGLKISILVINKLAFITLGVAALYAVIRISFGA